MKAIPALLVLAAVLSAAGCATAQIGAISRAQSGIEEGDYSFALQRLSEAEKYSDPTPETKAEIAYLRGICYEGLGRIADAKGSFQYVAESFPDSQYGYQAKARLAEMASK